MWNSMTLHPKTFADAKPAYLEPLKLGQGQVLEERAREREREQKSNGRRGCKRRKVYIMFVLHVKL